jgi:hypothetical protein
MKDEMELWEEPSLEDDLLDEEDEEEDKDENLEGDDNEEDEEDLDTSVSSRGHQLELIHSTEEHQETEKLRKARPRNENLKSSSRATDPRKKRKQK